MKKNVVKLNENTLKQIVAESVKKVLKEWDDAETVRTEGRELLNKVYPEYGEQIEEYLEGGYYTPGVPVSTAIASFEKFMENNDYFPM